MNLMWWNASRRVWESETKCERRGRAIFEAVEPRPWRIMNGFLCDCARGTITGSGYVVVVRGDADIGFAKILYAVPSRNETRSPESEL
jgi:hypothetical protein